MIYSLHLYAEQIAKFDLGNIVDDVFLLIYNISSNRTEVSS